MPGTGVSSTAVMAAVARGWHRLDDAWPLVFDDPYALSLVGPGWPERYERMRDTFREPVLRRATGAMVGRSRYTEDRLPGGDFGQYVILGAGLDSFAWRRPDVLRRLRVVEIDQPATQAWKRDRDCGLRVGEHPTRDEVHERYFAGRGDGLTVPTTQRLLTAIVPA
jgi:O-methyltransferase involved in polyketide biosynthesis